MRSDVDAVVDALRASLLPEIEAMIVRALAGRASAGVVNIDELGAALKVSESTVRRMVSAGMPVEWAASAMRFDVAACRAWTRARGKKSVTRAGESRPSTAGPVPGVTLKSRAR